MELKNCRVNLKLKNFITNLIAKYEINGATKS